MSTSDRDSPIQRRLRHRFDAAVARSLAVLNPDDAEPEMGQFLRLVDRHPEHRPFIAQLFIAAFDDGDNIAPPADFIRFCMSSLRWPEIREFVAARRDAEERRVGARTSPVWAEILGAFGGPTTGTTAPVAAASRERSV